ncbi:MAG: hypothetical protein A3G34_06665 [Candidatus Lindowbacteria bacterium RIFCSPLOWO2_12_FULL_62_27]|nr:MAG: hypothetical protein A3G34_06665 [Candidatus Lindowbacteria bacterium RIFCSPLOWO2_12_FULL_62_27]OGH63067.1 MAG: hypothetical protein A3I06_16570 [Candidatus Lindowbacteria bacterium RIFCSPLOWO2_02_FULL_62_12]
MKKDAGGRVRDSGEWIIGVGLILVAAGFLALFLLFVGARQAHAALSKSSPAGEEVWRLNCGGANYDYTDPAGNWWTRDEAFASLYRWGYANGSNRSTGNAISGTTQGPVYQDCREGGTTLSYKIEVPNGTYRVRLMLAELRWTAAGKRKFNIALEGTTLWTNVDPYALAGGRHKAVDLTADVTVSDGVLDVTFPAVYADKACLNGIEIRPLGVPDGAFLDFIQKKMFWYFWNEADVQTGLVKSTENNWKTGYGTVSSIAVDGFALSVYTVAAERGWITRQTAYDRVMKMLTSFETRLQNVHGFWYHFVNIGTGAREMNSEVSTVDSALFILGAIQAGRYFLSDHPDVWAKADLLYRRMDWTWFMNIGSDWQKRFVNMGWKPENDGYSYIISSGRPEGGFFCNDWWNRYSESIFVTLLALGSPTHSIGPAAWTDMGRWWAEAFGYRFIQEPPLFTHQYHHLYIDLRNIHDGGADYFENSVRAAQTNRLTCVTDAQARYEPDRWGLTACVGPDGAYHAYGGSPGGSHDGTVAPTAAVTSVMLTPAESIRAARYMFFQYKHHIWGRYGFTDAFNVGQTWRSQFVDGLNQAPMILAIENYNAGLVRNTFMSNPYIQSALALAGFKPFSEEPLVSSSTFEAPERNGAKAFDGDPNTRWASQWSDPQWLEIDYGGGRTFNQATIDWEYAHGRSYKIQSSSDGATWVDAFSTSSGDGGQDAAAFGEMTGRFWRLYGTERGTPYGYSIWEMKYEHSVNLALNKVVAASSIEDSGMEPARAVDGDLGTRWASQWSDAQWIWVDLGSPQAIRRVTLHWEYAYGKDYTLQTSDDSFNWTTRATIVGGDGGVDEVPLAGVTARYVRMDGTRRGTPYGYSLWEFQVQ